ncbi:alpha/beta hydrolase [Streptomyces sp. NBC_01450]|uniref:alpha/beta fold hydrolase n=1 Tax=Streptomyces sp. NBC_01450 TaxID=2903871 RepID=UPI002E2EE6DA|nr:alpha/beta hydrolase [Streptomyces sp. NBC_01450]
MSSNLRRSTAVNWKRRTVTITAGLLGLVSVGTAAASVPPTAADRAAASGRPTIVFVHGAFADSTGWDAEISRLQRLGYPVLAASDPLRGLTGDADYVRSILATISGPIVLVGHSYGGAVITNAARGVANVQALVYVGAFVPDKGESIATVLDPNTYPGSLLGAATTDVRQFPNPAAPGGTDADVYIKSADFRSVFAADVRAGTAARMAATQRPLSLTAETEPSGSPAWKTVPSWDLITLNDKAVPPAGQRFMAQRAHAHIETVNSSHAVMVSHPDAVVRIVLEAVENSG